VQELAAGHFGEDLWGLILEVAQIGDLVEKAVAALELSLVARQALEIAQRFNTFYQLKHYVNGAEEWFYMYDGRLP
jgi:arginyl-tRNA synthetase